LRNKAHIWIGVLSVLIEGLVIFLFLVPFAGGEQPWRLAGPFAAMAAVIAVGFLFSKPGGMPLHYGAAVAAVTVGMLLGLAIGVALVVAVLLFWRTAAALRGHTERNLWPIYLITAGVAFFYAFIFGFFDLSFLHPALFMLLFAMQTVLVLALRFAQAVRSGKAWRKVPASYALAFAALVLAVVLFALVGPFLRTGLLYVAEGAAYVIYYVYVGALGLIKAMRGDSLDAGKLERLRNRNFHPKERHWSDVNPHHSFGWLTWVGMGLLLFIIALLAIYVRNLMHERRSLMAFRRQLAGEAYAAPLGRGIAAGRRRKPRPPKDPVRYGLFRMETELGKGEKGRRAGETIGEWFARLPVAAEEKALIRSVYETVRYGHQSVGRDERVRYKQAVDAVIEAMKKREKDEESH